MTELAERAPHRVDHRSTNARVHVLRRPAPLGGTMARSNLESSTVQPRLDGAPTSSLPLGAMCESSLRSIRELSTQASGATGLFLQKEVRSRAGLLRGGVLGAGGLFNRVRRERNSPQFAD